MRNWKLISLVLAVALTLSLVAGCGDTKPTPSPSSAVNTGITIALGSDITALDPAFAYDFTTNPVVEQITEGLLRFDENDQLQPCLAKEWKAVDDTTYVYTIRDDVKFSDGTAMTMDDILFSLERTRSADTASYLGWMFDSADTIEQTGDWELTVKLKNPDATWQYVPATTACHIISKAYYEAHADNFGTPEGGLLGTGPYKFVSWQSGTEIVLAQNEYYWDTSVSMQVTDVIFKIVPEDTTRVTAMKNGEVDISVEPPLDMLQQLRDTENVSLSSTDTFGISFLAFNTQKAPFNDVNVRKAIYYSLNLQPLYENIIKEAGTPASTLPMSEALYTVETDTWKAYAASVPAYAYDLDAAKASLAASSVPDGFSCNLLITETSLSYSKGLAIQDALSQIGITVELVKLSSDEHTSYQFGSKMTADGIRDYDMILAGWEADYPDPSGNLVPLYTSANAGSGGANAAAYSNAEVDAYLDAQGKSTDPAERTALMLKALDIITEDVPYIFIEYPVKTCAINNRLTGFTMNASWLWNFSVKNIQFAG